MSDVVSHNEANVSSQHDSPRWLLLGLVLLTGLAEEAGAILVDAETLRSVRPDSFDEAGRRRNVERLQLIAAVLDRAGYDVAVAAVSPYRDQRETFKAEHGALEVYVHGETGLWDREYAGADCVYEPPELGFLDVDTSEVSLDKALELIIGEMNRTG